MITGTPRPGWKWKPLMGFLLPTLVGIGLIVYTAFLPNQGNGLILIEAAFVIAGGSGAVLYVRSNPRPRSRT